MTKAPQQSLLVAVVLLATALTVVARTSSSTMMTRAWLPRRRVGRINIMLSSMSMSIPRGGGGSLGGCEEEYDTEAYDTEEYDTEAEEEYDSKQVLNSELKEGSSLSGDIIYDSMLVPPAMQQLLVSVGVMALSNKIDILNIKAVRIARFAFVAYIVVAQVFLIYVRFRAKLADDQTEVVIDNPISALLSRADGSDSASTSASTSMLPAMMKNLASQALSTRSTVREYDLREAKKMNGALLFPMLFLYFLHFRMGQVQPLLMQTATGVLNLCYSPLFQAYVLGRKLERPFKPTPVITDDDDEPEQNDGVELIDNDEGDETDDTDETQSEDEGHVDESDGDQGSDEEDEGDETEAEAESEAETESESEHEGEQDSGEESEYDSDQD